VAEAELYRASDHHRALTLGGGSDDHAPPWRSSFRRDYARLIHCAAFRRLQGKTQLFAGLESDFFRNRLTHSLEVAQIAKSIALMLNSSRFANAPLDLDLVELAGLAHDLGHPPFGHTGEQILDELMREEGGFEGNAQTLRILCRLEKKLDDPERQLAGDPIWYEEDGQEVSVGLNLCSRSLAAILKYDETIPRRRKGEGLVKGHYLSEKGVVDRVWEDVLGGDARTAERPRRTIECQVMDLADDIAYSTYDLEDAFKAGLLTPLDLLSPSVELAADVARRVERELNVSTSPADVTTTLRRLFSEFSQPTEDLPTTGPAAADWYPDELAHSYRVSRTAAENGFVRTALTSALVNRFMQAVDAKVDHRRLPLSQIVMRDEERTEVSVLKHLTYVLLIRSNRMRLVAHRAGQMIREIFGALTEPDGETLLPPDVAERFRQAPSHQKKRVVCDYIAGMTDRYAVEFYARLTSETFYSMFKPH
jgi:dGTPase